MTYMRSEDGTTPGRRVNELPNKVWIQDTVKAGHYEPLTEQNMNDHGIYSFTVTTQPDADHISTIERVGAGFETVWTFDQVTADSNADAVADEAERTAVRGLLADLTTMIDMETMTNLQQTTAINKLARAVIRLVKDSI